MKESTELFLNSKNSVLSFVLDRAKQLLFPAQEVDFLLTGIT